MKRYQILIPIVKYIECYADVPDRDEAICRADDLVQMLEDENVDLTKLYSNGKVVYAKPIVKRVKEKKENDK